MDPLIETVNSVLTNEAAKFQTQMIYQWEATLASGEKRVVTARKKVSNQQVFAYLKNKYPDNDTTKTKIKFLGSSELDM